MTSNINRIKAVLAEKQKTSLWLADQLYVNPTTVSRWCTNKSQPDLHTLHRIAALLQVDQRDLLTSTTPKTNII